MSKPIKKILPYILIFVLLSVVVAILYSRSTFQREQNAFTHMPMLEEKQIISLEHAKIRKPVFVKIQLQKSLTNWLSGKQELIGSAFINTAYDNEIFYLWELPEGVTLIEGSLNGSWKSIKAGDVLQSTIVVSGFTSDAAKNIVFHGQFRKGQLNLGSSAVLASNPEQTVEGKVLSKMRK